MTATSGADVTRAILETSLEAFISMNAEGKIIDCNREAERTFGWLREAVVGRDLATLLVPERHREAYRIELARVVGGGASRLIGRRLELTALHADGRELPIEVTVSHTEGGPGIAFHGFLHDISERKLAEHVLRRLQSVTAAMMRAGTPDQALAALLANLGTGMEWAVGFYWGRIEDGTLQLRSSWTAPGVSAEPVHAAGRRVEREGGPALPALAVERGEPVWEADMGAASLSRRAEAAREVGLRTAIVVPVKRDGDVTGVIEFFATQRRVPDETVTAALSTVGDHIGELVAILEERHALIARLEALALTDGLTGLPNRRAWVEAVDRELARSARDGHPVCVAVVDLDNFKGFNDEFGHQAGDSLLTEAAHAWRAQLRAGDLLARYGGEEFAAVIPGRALDASLVIVERVRGATPGGRTCSAGVACWNGEESAAELFARADAAMYDAKRAGRDRTVIAD